MRIKIRSDGWGRVEGHTFSGRWPILSTGKAAYPALSRIEGFTPPDEYGRQEADPDGIWLYFGALVTDGTYDVY